MKRDVERMAQTAFDVVVVGGGIYGVCAAWEAALRGLKVGLLERADFGGGTSFNSLRTVHGGLRYLQHLDFKRMRESIRERRAWLRLAPDLVRPQRFVMPTHGHGLKGPEVLRVALWLNDVIGADRNSGVAADRALCSGGVLSEAQARSVFAQTSVESPNGAAFWHDAVFLSPQRLLIGIARAAVEHGAQLANRLEATQLVLKDGAVQAIQARDHVTGRNVILKTRCVLNAAGPWVDEWLQGSATLSQPMFRPSLAFNLWTRRLPFADAIGLPVARTLPDADLLVNKGSQTYFVLPWQGGSLIGTRHLRCTPAAQTVGPAEVQAFLAEMNDLLGKHRLAAADVRGVYSGFLPERADVAGSEVVLQKHAAIIDHAETGGPRGLVSMVGVKLTTARSVAERAVERLCKVKGGAMAPRQLPSSPAATASLDERVIFAIREEMAPELADVAFRRTELYLDSEHAERKLAAAADVMGAELNWEPDQRASQMDRALEALATFRNFASASR